MREGPPEVECSRCFKMVYPDELELLAEKDTHGFYPSGIHVCKQCHKEVKNMAQEKLHEKEAVQSSTG